MFLYLSSQWSVISAGWRCELKKDWASLRRATPHSDIRRMARYADREATVRWAVRQTGRGRQSGFGNANASVRMIRELAQKDPDNFRQLYMERKIGRAHV